MKMTWSKPDFQELDVKMTAMHWTGSGSDGWIATDISDPNNPISVPLLQS